MTKELYLTLLSLYKILEDEKIALIEDDGQMVGELVNLKIDLLEKLEAYKDQDIEINDEIIELTQKIKDLQETNLMLTHQALEYSNKMVDSISHVMVENVGTYSPYGQYDKQTANLIDKSL